MKKLAVAAAASGVAAALGAAAWVAERQVVRGVRRRPDPDADFDFTLPFDEQFTVRTDDGGELTGYTKGSGPPIVLMHGWMLTSQIWCKQFTTLTERGFRVVAYDQRGHGASTLGGDGYTPARLGADLRSVLETSDVRDAVLVGHSMGGLAVQACAGTNPDAVAERARGLVLLSTLALTLVGDTIGGFLERVHSWTPDVARLMKRADLGLLLVRAGFGREPMPSHIELTRRLIAASPPRARRDAGRMLARVDITDLLPTIRQPALVVVGSADLLTPVAAARRMCDLLPHGRLEVIEGGGHMLMLERTKELDDLLVELASEVGA